MNKEKAQAYLRRKGKPVTEERVDEVMREGKIYGDPVADCQ